jgi:hypothetical protein
MTESWADAYTDEFERWWESLSEDEQVEIAAKVELLERRGRLCPVRMPTLLQPRGTRT